MTVPNPDVEASEWYDELDTLEDLARLEEGSGDEEEATLLHDESDTQKPDDDIGRAAEDLEALTESA